MSDTLKFEDFLLTEKKFSHMVQSDCILFILETAFSFKALANFEVGFSNLEGGLGFLSDPHASQLCVLGL